MKTIQLLIICICFSLFFNYSLYGQNQKVPTNATIKSNSLYFEAFGNGIVYSINYEHLFTDNLGGRIGFMYSPSLDIIFTSTKSFLTVPVILNYFIGENHKLELGGGIVYVSVAEVGFLGFNDNRGGSAVIGTAVVGYRYQPKYSGFLFKIGLTPFFNQNGAFVSGGVGIGLNF
ncbi:MAG TPA: hypothetical protein PKD03_08635 [Ignavibacteriaceae bacterium]|nr:hypothetical protein [Ignavibacteriaceae bacterium]